ncbi:protein of unknown function (plasmid) [Caballeronia sp. S22]
MNRDVILHQWKHVRRITSAIFFNAALRLGCRRVVGIVRSVFHIFLQIANLLTGFAGDLLRVALRFLCRIIRHLVDALVDITLHFLANAFDLVFIHGLAPFAACGPQANRSTQGQCRRSSCLKESHIAYRADGRHVTGFTDMPGTADGLTATLQLAAKQASEEVRRSRALEGPVLEFRKTRPAA